jgi:hypothetical protein
VLERRRFGRVLPQPFEQRRDSLGQPAQHGVRERDRALEACAPHQLHRFVDGRVRRDVGIAELVRTQSQCCAHRRIELAHRPLPQRADRVVERAYALHRPEGEALRQRTIARIQPLGSRTQDAVGVRLVLEDAQDDLVRRLPRRQRRPRRNSSYAMRRCRPAAPRAAPAAAGDARLPDRDAAPVQLRPRADVRRECTDPVQQLLGGSFQSSSRSAALIFSA